VDACCAAEFGWITKGLCISRSNENVTEKYWPDRAKNKCVKDDKTAAIDLSVKLYNSAEECCETDISWVRLIECIAKTKSVAAHGSNKYYVNWITRNCIKDCEGAALCGGIAKKWDSLYASANECCKNLWNDPEECF